MSRLSLAAKLYSIFALFALLTAAITVLSDYNTRRNARAHEGDRDRQPRRAQRRARQFAGLCGRDGIPRRLHVDRTRRREEVRRRAAQVQRHRSSPWSRTGNPSSRPTTPSNSPTFKKRIEQFVEFRKELVRRGIEINAAAGREWGDNDANRAVRSALNKDLEALSKVYAERGKQIARQGQTNRTLAFLLTCLGGLALVVVGLGVVIISRSIARPLSAITATIKRVAEGAENVEVPHTDRADEIGALARAIRIFQEAMDRNRNLNSQVSQDSKAREAAHPAHRNLGRSSSAARSAACCARSPTMRRRCAIPRSPSPG